MIQKKKLTACLVWSICLMWLLVLCPSCQSGEAARSDGSVSASSENLEEPVPDTEGPVISGVQDLTTTVGETVSYRTGVTARDDRDGAVMLMVDSSGVNLSAAGEYQVIYSAEDSAGNRTEVTAAVVVTEPEPAPPSDDGQKSGQVKEASQEKVNDLADQILAKILKDGMSRREQARAIFDYVAKSVKYVGSSDKSSWLVGAYDGFTTGRGDCFNYYACSRVLLTRAGIPIVPLQRVNGNSRHYWVLTDVGEGFYHFDPCPHPKGYPLTCFLLTEAEVREYTTNLAAHSSYYINYYTYDYSLCPVRVEGMPEEESPEPAEESADGQSEPDELAQDGSSEPSADTPAEADNDGPTA